MKIDTVSVKNYRNIDGIRVTLNPETNFIIGDNNLGKSNFLTILSAVCDGKSVSEQDFLDPDKPVEIELKIQLNQNEPGFFGENLAPRDSSSFTILYSQAIDEVYPSLICADTGESINPHQMRKLNILKYEPMSAPSRELRLETQRGTDLLVGTMIERYSKGENLSFLNDDRITDLTDYINENLGKIRSFRDSSIRATVASNPIGMLTDLFFLAEGGRRIDAAGSGMQYMSMATINILCQIMDLYKSKAMPFSELLYTDEAGNRLLPIILSVDEPEAHLHPYLQRSLIGYYKKILSNNEPEFRELLKVCFDIDGLDGQLIIVTHSTDALAGDYRNLIRFYKRGNELAAVSGYSLQPDFDENDGNSIRPKNEKHLIMHFPELKEAFYAKCAILIEGETEYGCIHAFADKIGISLDDYGICVIDAHGQTSIKPLRQLLDSFKIPSIAIYDGDVNSKPVTGKKDPNKFFTTEQCFESEIVKTLVSSGNTEKVKEIALDIDSQAEYRTVDADTVRKYAKKVGLDAAEYVPKRLSEVNDKDPEEFWQIYSLWFMSKKGVLLGRIIGDDISEKDIPDCYRNAIKRAREVALKK